MIRDGVTFSREKKIKKNCTNHLRDYSAFRTINTHKKGADKSDNMLCYLCVQHVIIHSTMLYVFMHACICFCQSQTKYDIQQINSSQFQRRIILPKTPFTSNAQICSVSIWVIQYNQNELDENNKLRLIDTSFNSSCSEYVYFLKRVLSFKLLCFQNNYTKEGTQRQFSYNKCVILYGNAF